MGDTEKPRPRLSDLIGPSTPYPNWRAMAREAASIRPGPSQRRAMLAALEETIIDVAGRLHMWDVEDERGWFAKDVCGAVAKLAERSACQPLEDALETWAAQLLVNVIDEDRRGFRVMCVRDGDLRIQVRDWAIRKAKRHFQDVLQ